MGASTSKKFAGCWSNMLRPTEKEAVNEESNVVVDPRDVKTDPSQFLVTTRRSSQFFDEDGFLAHEFWEVVPKASPSQLPMRQVTKNLTPQGHVPYEVPRLSAEYPYVIADLR